MIALWLDFALAWSGLFNFPPFLLSSAVIVNLEQYLCLDPFSRQINQI